MSGDLEGKAIDEMKAVLDEESGGDGESESESEDEGTIKMDFSKKGGNVKVQKVERGISGMKFM